MQEILLLDILTLLVQTPTDDYIEVATAVLKESGMKHTQPSPNRAALLRGTAKPSMPRLVVKTILNPPVAGSDPYSTRRRRDALVAPWVTTRGLDFGPPLAPRFRPYRWAPRLTLPWSVPFPFSPNCALILPLQRALSRALSPSKCIYYSLYRVCIVPLHVTCHSRAAPAALLMVSPGPARVCVCVDIFTRLV